MKFDITLLIWIPYSCTAIRFQFLLVSFIKGLVIIVLFSGLTTRTGSTRYKLNQMPCCCVLTLSFFLWFITKAGGLFCDIQCHACANRRVRLIIWIKQNNACGQGPNVVHRTYVEFPSPITRDFLPTLSVLNLFIRIAVCNLICLYIIKIDLNCCFVFSAGYY